MNKKIVASWVSLAIVLSFMVIIIDIAPVVEAPNTWYVDDSNPGPGDGSPGNPFKTIQAGVDNATPGDTVFVYNGTYYEHVVVNKTINLTGEDKDTTIIDGEGNGVVMNITDYRVNISGFTIRKCGGEPNAGVIIFETEHCQVSDCNISFNYYHGIYLWHSNYNIIINNNISNNKHGLFLWYASNNYIINNNITSNDWDGLNLDWWSNNNNITNNNISSNNRYGIYMMLSDNNNIINNIISNEYGFSIGFCSNQNIKNNVFTKNSIMLRGNWLSHWDSHTIENNIANGRPIYYYKNMTAFIVPTDAAEVILANCSNFTITNLNISNVDVGIILGFSSHNDISDNNMTLNNWYGADIWFSNDNNLRDNIVSNNWAGIYVYSSSNQSLTNNNILNNDYGIYIQYSPENNITNNTVLNNNWGIYFDSSSRNTINGNNASNNQIGIYLYSSSLNNISNNNVLNNEYGMLLWFSLNNNVTRNNISNKHSGIRLEESSKNNNIINNNVYDNEYGIIIFSSSNNSITNNNLSSNDSHGISMGPSSDNNIIINNNIMLNGGYGVVLRGSNNIVGNNNISSNTWYGIQLHGIFTKHNLIINNNISDNWRCIYIETASNNNSIYHNNFYNNLNPAYDDTNKNFWNDTYPSGGNYWSDYSGVDNYKGPNQNILGRDGIGDTPYINIDGGAGARDNYPLIQPYKPLENFTILKQGWNLISIPLTQQEQNLIKVLGSIEGWYDAVQWYDVTDSSDLWKHHRPGKPYGNDLSKINESMGFWVHITQPGDTIFIYNGTQPTENQTITLHPGWNLVGYPSLRSYNRTQGLNNLTFDTHVDAIWTHDSATQKWKKIGPLDFFEPCRGYWFHAKTKCEWEVPL